MDSLIRHLIVHLLLFLWNLLHDPLPLNICFFILSFIHLSHHSSHWCFPIFFLVLNWYICMIFFAWVPNHYAFIKSRVKFSNLSIFSLDITFSSKHSVMIHICWSSFPKLVGHIINFISKNSPILDMNYCVYCLYPKYKFQLRVFHHSFGHFLHYYSLPFNNSILLRCVGYWEMSLYPMFTIEIYEFLWCKLFSIVWSQTLDFLLFFNFDHFLVYLEVFKSLWLIPEKEKYSHPFVFINQ